MEEWHCSGCGSTDTKKRAKGLCSKCYMIRWRKEHQEHILEYSCQYYQEHKKERGEYNRQWCEANPEYYHQRYETRREEAYEYTCQWREENPDKAREQKHRRRARKNGATIGPVDEAAIYERDKVCIYCGSAEDLTIDHLIPLTREGPHCQDNLAVACRPCNSSKGAKTYEEFLTTQ